MGSSAWQGGFSVKDLVRTMWLVSHVVIPGIFFSCRRERGGKRQSACAERVVNTLGGAARGQAWQLSTLCQRSDL